MRARRKNWLESTALLGKMAEKESAGELNKQLFLLYFIPDTNVPPSQLTS